MVWLCVKHLPHADHRTPVWYGYCLWVRDPVVRTTPFLSTRGEGMSEMEMLKELRRIIAIVAEQDLAAERTTGTIAHAKDQVREDLVAMAQEKFAGNLASAKNGIG